MRFGLAIQLLAVLFILITLPGYCGRVSAKPDSSVMEPAFLLSQSFSSLVKQVRPSVVSVFSTRVLRLKLKDMPDPIREQFLRDYYGIRGGLPRNPDLLREYRIPQTGAGSGIILDSAGNILTNYHLVNQFDEIMVLFQDRKKRKAKLIGRDPKTDLAVIRIQETEGIQLAPIGFGDSDDLKVGELVMAIGTPFGLPNSVSHGIVSATGRNELGLVDEEDFIQTDAPINPGNSGGPLLNMKGEVIGVNSAIASLFGSSMGIGFSIPSNKLKNLIPRMIRGETIVRAELGVWIEEPDREGVLISRVIPGSPAEKSGLKIGDLILAVNDETVSGVGMVRKKISVSKPGDSLSFRIQRGIETIQIKVTLGTS